MIIKTLVENTPYNEKFGCEHGLSLYIETNNQKILFDVGETDLFLKNASILKVDIGDVESLIISHGHKDHGGGLENFLNSNNKAKVYVNKNAFNPHYASRPNNKLKDIGLDTNLEDHKQIIKLDKNQSISDGVEILTNIPIRYKKPISNDGLYEIVSKQYVKDSFNHEQNLIIEEQGKTILIVGCAHNGIINILEHFKDIKGNFPDYVIGGFHLSSRSSGNETAETIDEIAKYLLSTKVKYYTCHCTGVDAYHRLKEIMGDNIDYLSAGSEIIL